MFKKNQLALILLTLVMMLTVYFIKSPNNNEKPDDQNQPTETTGRLEALSTMRLTLKNERNEQITALDAIIGSKDATTVEINNAIEQKNAINATTECELLLELEIMNLGYQDAFVHATDKSVDVTVVANEHSISKANEIIKMTILEFNGKYSDVCVEFETVEEVMGTVKEVA